MVEKLYEIEVWRPNKPVGAIRLAMVYKLFTIEQLGKFIEEKLAGRPDCSIVVRLKEGTDGG